LPDFVRGLKYSVFWYALSISLFRLTQLFTAPILGYLADKWGRKPIFLLATSGTFVSYLLMTPLNLPALLANRLIDGSTNGFYTAVRAAITDLSTPKNLAKNLGVLGALGAIGVVLGPALGAVLIGHGPLQYSLTGNQRILFIALFLALVNIVLSLFIKETLPSRTKKQTAVQVARQAKLDKLKEEIIEENSQVENIDMIDGELVVSNRFRYQDIWPQFVQICHNQRSLGILILIEILTVIIYSYYQYFLIFADKRLHFQPQDVALFMIYIGVCIGITQIVFFRFIFNRLNPKMTLIFSSLVGGLVLICYSFVQVAWQLYFFAIFDVISLSLIGGIVQGQIGHLSPPHKRGSIVGLVQGFSGIVAFLNPLIYGYLGQKNINLPFFWFALCAFLVTILAFQLDDSVDTREEKYRQASEGLGQIEI
jgi:DHA1 family tetracycline resistance protein-like MFS transporter